jgi:two-component system, chemotaxis family, chemotaxis protein CheY
MTRILVVDDNEALRDTIAIVLAKAGYTLACAAGGQEALALCKLRSFDLVITDVLMPGMDGIELLMALRRLPASPKVITMSAGGRLHARAYLEIAETIGVAGVLTKPLDAAVLLAAVSDALGVEGGRPQPQTL